MAELWERVGKEGTHKGQKRPDFDQPSAAKDKTDRREGGSRVSDGVGTKHTALLSIPSPT